MAVDIGNRHLYKDRYKLDKFRGHEGVMVGDLYFIHAVAPEKTDEVIVMIYILHRLTFQL